MKKDYISIIIVNWNGKKWLDKCLSSFLNQTYKKLEIILVDNASTDGSVEHVTENFPNIKIIRNNKNLGFAAGNNTGIKEARGEYILRIDSDTWVENDFLERLLEFYENHDFDVIGPREKRYDGTGISNSYSPIDFLGNPAYRAVLKTKRPFALSGMCLFFKKSFYLETKGLDEDFFMYFEDVDWFWRLQLLKKKFDIAEGIYVHHFGSGSSEGGELKHKMFLWRNQNSLQMLLKNYSSKALIVILPIYFVQNLFEILFFCLTLKPSLVYTYIQGWMFNIENLPKTLRKRSWIQSHRVVSDSVIIRNMSLMPLRLVGLINYLKFSILR